MRREFTKKIKLAAWERANGHCEMCSAKLYPGRFDYDHRIADSLGGDPTLDNCVVACSSCHGHKTRKLDVPAIAKAKRRQLSHAGIKKPRSIRAWRKFNGTAVYASRER